MAEQGEGSKKSNKDLKHKKKGINKKQNKDQEKTKILKNSESFKDWGSRVQGRGRIKKT